MLPGVAGFLLEREVTFLNRLVEDPERPFVVVLGGAKVSDKIGVIERFLELADAILIGGAMCFSFFRAQGRPTGDSLVEEEGVELARRALERAEQSVPARAAERPRDRRPLRRGRGDARSTGSTCRTAGWASTSARARGRPTPTRSPRQDGVLERADGRLRAGAVRRRHAGDRRGDGGERARRWSAAGTRRRRSSASGWPRR